MQQWQRVCFSKPRTFVYILAASMLVELESRRTVAAEASDEISTDMPYRYRVIRGNCRENHTCKDIQFVHIPTGHKLASFSFELVHSSISTHWPSIVLRVKPDGHDLTYTYNIYFIRFLIFSLFEVLESSQKTVLTRKMVIYQFLVCVLDDL